MNIPVTLNVKSANAIPVISCMQGDTPILVCTIMNGTEKFVVNKAEFDLCVCEGETAKHKAVTINASTNGNTVSVKMTKNETDEAGDIKLCIRFSNTRNNTVISTFPFILKATQNPSYTAAGQMDDVSALTDYVAEAKKYADSAKETTADVSTLAQKTTEKAQEAESSATAAKESANIAGNRATEAQEAAAATLKSSSTATSAAEYTASCRKEIEQLASEVENNSNIAKSYAVGETSARDNEDIDNAKYYSQQAKKYADEAQQIVGGNFIPNSEKGIAGGVAVLNANLAVEKAVADENGNNIQETYAKKTEIGEIIEVDSELSATSTNPVQNKIVTAAINSASQQAGIANGKLEQWQAQGRIPNGIANNLVTTEEGYVADARQLNKSVENSFAYEMDKSISAINNSLSKIISASAYLEIPYHKFWVSFFRIGDFCFATCTHICSGGSWATGAIFTPKEYRPENTASIPNVYVELRTDGTIAGLQEGGNNTFYGFVVYKCLN
jgi:hypothetical protein